MVDQVASHYIRDWEAAHFVDVVSYLYYRVPRVAVLPCLFSLCVIISICVCRLSREVFSVFSIIRAIFLGRTGIACLEVTSAPRKTVAYSRYVHKYISYDPLPKLHKT